uniref:GP98 n=1 Tax=Caviid herpesvirus 2 str. CIDMTR TaxID=1415526 RepID=U6HC56_9BETA|nr:GP98 [Caviid herpesvirus 2 str. CIDMTR]
MTDEAAGPSRDGGGNGSGGDSRDGDDGRGGGAASRKRGLSEGDDRRDDPGDGLGLERMWALFSDEPMTLFLSDKFILRRAEAEKVPYYALRLTYLYYMFKKTNVLYPDIGACASFVAVVDEETLRFRNAADLRGDVLRFSDDQFMTFARDLFVACGGGRRLDRLLCHLERGTRGQTENSVWHVLRGETITATRFYQTLVSDRAAVRFENPGSQRYAESVAFGRAREPTVKRLIEVFVEKRTEPVVGGLGLLLDPGSAVLGASLDLCFGVSESREEGLLRVHERARIFEIKCRYKYLRACEDPYVLRVLRESTAESVVAFLLSHKIPAVDYRREGEIPGTHEFLMSHDGAFETRKRTRPGRVATNLKPHIPDLVSLNRALSSEVIVFHTTTASGETINGSPDVPVRDEERVVGDEIDDLGGENDDGNEDDSISGRETPELSDAVFLRERARFRLPVFVNPRHPNFFQVLLQHYVLSQYYCCQHEDPESIDPEQLPSANLVSAIFRKRSEREAGKDVYLDGRRLDCDDIPLFIVITPLAFDHRVTGNVVARVLSAWEIAVRKCSGVSIWVPDSVRRFVATARGRVPSPCTITAETK